MTLRAPRKPIQQELRAVVFASELGWMCASWRGERLRELTFGYPDPEQAIRALRYDPVVPDEPGRGEKQFITRLQAFARQPADDLSDLQLDLSEHTDFQRKIVACCRAISIGETITYAELAARSGHPGAARAAGQVMATNRFPLIVPCHRVVGSGGSLGGYSAPDGLQMKRRLLELENLANVG